MFHITITFFNNNKKKRSFINETIGVHCVQGALRPHTHARTCTHMICILITIKVKKNPHIVNHNHMRNAVCARAKTKHQNQWNILLLFFPFGYPCETHRYGIVYIYFFCEKRKFHEAIENSAQKKQRSLLALVCLTWEAKTKSKKKITYPTAIKCYYGILGYGESFDVMRLFHFSAIRLPIYGLLRSTTITTTAITHHHSKCYWNIYHSTEHTRARARFCTLTIHTI